MSRRVPGPFHRFQQRTSTRFPASGVVNCRTDQLLLLALETDDGWWLLGASGTEPKLTARCEAADTEGLERLQRALMTHLARSGISARMLRTGG